MPNPNFPVNCPKDQYTKIATNVTSGNVHKMKTDADYLQTYRLTAEAAPTLKNEAVRMFVDNPEEEMIRNSPAAIDIYVWCCNEDGILRVDV